MAREDFDFREFGHGKIIAATRQSAAKIKFPAFCRKPLRHERPDFFAHHHTAKIVLLAEIKNDDRHFIIHA